MKVNRIFNVVLVSFGFFWILAGYIPTLSLQTVVIQDAIAQSNGTLSANGYVSLAIVYSVKGIVQWTSPVIISGIGPRIALTGASLTYVLFCLNFLWLKTWSLYFSSAVLGVGTAVLWTARAAYAGRNSSSQTATRNSGIFMIFQSFSAILSSLFSFHVLRGRTEVTEETRKRFFIVMCGLTAMGAVNFAFLPSMKGRVLVQTLWSKCRGRDEKDEEDSPPPIFYWRRFQETCRLSVSMNQLLVAPIAWTTGILTALTSVYATCIANTSAFGGDATSAAGLAGVFVALGKVVGSLLVFAIGRTVLHNQRHLVVLLGAGAVLTALLLTMMTTAPLSPFQRTNAATIMAPNLYVAMLINFMFGFGWMSYCAEFYALATDFLRFDTMSAAALFSFHQAVGAAATFIYSRLLVLHWQFMITVVIVCLGTLSFVALQWKLMADRAATKFLEEIELPTLVPLRRYTGIGAEDLEAESVMEGSDKEELAEEEEDFL